MNNKQTVATYNDEFEVYINNTATEVSGSIKEFLDRFLAHVDTDSSILEIGSGTGRDATYIEDNGYENVLRTDAAENFVNHMRKNGSKAEVLDIVSSKLDKTFDAIVSDAVFLHFNEQEFTSAMHNTLSMLNSDGVFALSLHEGSFKGVSDHKHSARYFHQWQEDEIKQFLEQFDVKILETFKGESVSKRNTWVMLILQKV